MSCPGDEEADVESCSHFVYTFKRTRAITAGQQAQRFLTQLSHEKRASDTASFREFRALIDHVTQEILRHYIQPETYDRMCARLRGVICAFHEAVAVALESLQEPFYYYDEALARPRNTLVLYFKALDGMQCCGRRLIIAIPPPEGTESAPPEEIAGGSTVEVIIPPPRQQNLPGVLCDVCGQRIPLSCLLEEKVTSRCQHQTLTCLPCLRESIATQLDGDVEDLTCPLCTMTISGATVEKYGSREMIEKHQARLFFSETPSTKTVPAASKTVPRTIATPAPRPKCAICWEEILLGELLGDRITTQCEHEAISCISCLRGSIAAQLDRGWDKITCPLCTILLNSTIVEKHSSVETIERYHRYMISDAFKDEPTFRRCLRPNCQFGQVHERADAEPLMSCGDCGYKMCYVHQRPWHEGQTCSQYDYALSHREQWERENAASLALIESSFTACPQCGIRIEKNKGCDHMTCTHCRFEFCWQCLSPYEPIRQHGNTGHAASCRYHSANLPAMALLNPLQYFPDD